MEQESAPPEVVEARRTVAEIVGAEHPVMARAVLEGVLDDGRFFLVSQALDGLAALGRDAAVIARAEALLVDAARTVPIDGLAAVAAHIDEVLAAPIGTTVHCGPGPATDEVEEVQALDPLPRAARPRVPQVGDRPSGGRRGWTARGSLAGDRPSGARGGSRARSGRRRRRPPTNVAAPEIARADRRRRPVPSAVDHHAADAASRRVVPSPLHERARPPPREPTRRHPP